MLATLQFTLPLAALALWIWCEWEDIRWTWEDNFKEE
jgi:hypothetical protein